MTKEEMERLTALLDAHPNKMDASEYTSHHFSEGLYIREMYLPQGTMLVGKEHLRENFFHLVAGKLSIWSEDGEVTIEAPWMGIVPVGAKRVGYAHEDSICFNTIPNPDNETDIPTLERTLFREDRELYERDFKSAAITLAAVSVASTVYGGIQGAKSTAASRKGSKQRRQSDLMSQFLKRRQMLQEYRMAQAASLSGAVASGADLESSGYQGVRSSVYSQADYNLRSEEAILAKEKKAYGFDMQASRLSESSNLWNSIGQVAGMFSGMIGSPAKMSDAQVKAAYPIDTSFTPLQGQAWNMGSNGGLGGASLLKAPADVVNQGAFKINMNGGN
jgi:hypothetical protein